MSGRYTALMQDAAGELVFVYGTLRRGGSNAFRMDGADFVSSGKVAGKLYAITWYPGLVLQGEGTVDGDLFRVGRDQLVALDEFEGISANEIEGAEYRRVKTEVATADDQVFAAWAYEWIGPVDESKRIISGDWLQDGRGVE
ncbi:gamma-glutamylcyclotransferase [Luteolibacter flavescens]|uniref:Gamma-glutamylcyclotransferase n=1 Tax=Luteolibacter flavescens TaxID=1859460 RepID=A0ABT3FW65_9BACT|nr:gamma-glutamylcyclotransferase family protein [Luteolibacter flavescens]MCW1887836.1 gamma-glutamylcyclotransferase [Luteolibacter flavescens]